VLSASCQTNTADLSAITAGNAPSGSVLSWHSGIPATSANRVLNLATVAPGTYYASFYDGSNNCYASNSLMVVVTSPFCVSNICPDTTVNLTTALSSFSIPAGTQLTWHTGLPATNANRVANPAAVGANNYYAAFYDPVNGCYSGNGYAVREVIVTINQCNEVCNNGIDDDHDGLIDCADPDCNNLFVVATIATSPTICFGESTTISALASNGFGPYTYEWGNGLGSGISQNISPTTNTTYTVTATGSSGCSATASLGIVVNTCAENCTDGIDNDLDGLIDCADPDCGINATAAAANATCGNINGQVTIVPSSGSGSYEYSANNSTWQVSNSFTSVAPGSHTYYVRNAADNSCPVTVGASVADGCENCTDGIDNDGDGLVDCADSDCAPALSISSSQSLCLGSTASLSVNAAGANGPYTISWSNGLGTGSTKNVSPTGTTTYTVTATASVGCTSTAQVTVTVVPCPENCLDGIDNDGDGLVDCADPDCQAVGMPQLVPDVFTSCPGVAYTNMVSVNDGNLQNPVYSISTPPAKGSILMNSFGAFTYLPADNNCNAVSFTYQVCNQATGCCATQSATINLGDTTPPAMLNVPADLTISCDDAVPPPTAVFGVDSCPGITTEFEETNTMGNTGACASYLITRTWKFTDLCENSVVDSQRITVMDNVKPEIFRVYTLPNGKKLVAGVAQNTSNLWKYVKFPIHFDTPPIILAQVSSQNDASPVVVQTRYISTAGFEVRLQEEEAADKQHGGERVSWVALESGTHSGITPFIAGTLNAFNHNAQALNYAFPFASPPALLTSLQGTVEADAASVRVASQTSTGVQLSLKEEQSADAETNHANERLGYLAIKADANLRNFEGDFLAESGTVLADHNWVTVTLRHTYNKPVVVLGGLSASDPDAATIRVRNVSATSFQVRVQEWSYLDGIHAPQQLSYLVIEGGLPMDVDIYCRGTSKLQVGKDLIAVDNCDGQVAFGLIDNNNELVNGMETVNTWAAIDDCGNVNLQSRTDTCKVAAVRLKTAFAGALYQTNSGMMRDDLRSGQLMPIKQPYQNLLGYSAVAGAESVSPNLLSQAGPQAVVDWLFVECRSSSNEKTVLSAVTVLVRRDGSVVSPSGDDIIYFWDVPEGDYYLSIRHRNHLGLMTDHVWTLTSDAPPMIDFVNDSTDVRGGEFSSKKIGGQKGLWGGDFNGDGKVIYQGPGNDVFALFLKVLGDSRNTESLSNFISSGYLREDYNMDGRAIYQGPNNDRSMMLLNTILATPKNALLLANYIVLQQLP
jgi:hypothetical protein